MLTQEYLKSILNYNPDTGLFTWIKPTGKRVKAGYIAGCVCKDSGYISIRITKMYRAHRLAFLYMTGKFPDQTDHVNGIRTDNRWENLRDVSAFDNLHNIGIPTHNKSGVMGVFWNVGKQKWTAKIKLHRKNIHIGHYDNFKDAVAARKNKENELGFHANHGERKSHKLQQGDA